ncbi:MAG: ribose 5-phosphate isomerase B [Alphaproteobacteria bacterium]|nr:ribose 5-phosphate isomerase B [Alphaproteobacteria bacterium]
MTTDIIAIASDHAGYGLKCDIGHELSSLGYEVLDLGANSEDSVDYPDFADALAAAIHDGRARRGVLVCGSGIGISMAANRHRGIRAAPCYTEEAARLARRHNDANVLALGSRFTDLDTAKRCLRAFLETEFEGGRHARRVDKLDSIAAAAAPGD